MKKSRPPALPCRLIAALFVMVSVAPGAAPARPDLCEGAALRASAESGVPADVLMAIALVESGRAIDGRMRPWPWAANADGRGHWFASADEAARFARRQLARGQTSFDLGCFQINWRWHGQHFDRPEALLDPLVSARYAARFLLQLHDEFGSWEAAAGAYHSRSPHLAQAYRARFASHRARLAHLAPDAAPGPRAQRRPPTHGPMAHHRDAPDARASGHALPAAGRAVVSLALLQPGAASHDPASLVPGSTPGSALFAPARPAPGADAGLPVPAPPTASTGPLAARAAGIALQPSGHSPAFIPALTGNAP